ncbi:MAG: ribosome biogenesis GTPase YlqF [Oscillospiraceae bacterium]|nr:ribosome biogenesis GTPase YlqF [Oscillospiraceae bacterium]
MATNDITIQWFPGHMAKTRRLMTDSLKLVDAVVEVTDARIPQSSRNPEMDELVGRKPRIVLLNKCDTADETVTSRWIQKYKESGIPALATDCKSGRNVSKVLPLVREALKDTIERWNAKGMTGRAVRLMIVGIPNVGKSSLINRLSGTKSTKVEDRPGVTKGKQWVTLSKDFELLDMPGVLWPKFEDQNVGLALAFTGAVKDDIMDMESLAVHFIAKLRAVSLVPLETRYKISVSDDLTDYEILELIGRKRGFLVSGGEIDTERAAIMLMDEFRSGKLGRISLETP